MSLTINEIAELAGVSRATVDKVIHNRPGIKEETRVRIQTILDNVGYQPNMLGKALVLSKNPVKIGIITTPEYNPFIQMLINGIKKGQHEFAPFGFEVIVKMPSSLEPAELLSIILELETMNISGLALIPIDDPCIIAKLNSMQENGTPILTFNSLLKDIHGIRYIGQNHYKAGYVAAGLIEKLLPDKSKIGIIISSKTLSCHPDRLHGFKDRLAEGKKQFQIIGIDENQDKKEETFRIALSYLNTHPDLDGLYLSGNGTAGVKAALAVSGKAKHVTIVCHDLVPETEPLLQEGTVDFVISQNAKEQGYQIVRQFFNFLIRMNPPKEYFYEIPIQIFTREML